MSEMFFCLVSSNPITNFKAPSIADGNIPEYTCPAMSSDNSLSLTICVMCCLLKSSSPPTTPPSARVLSPTKSLKV